MNPPTTTAPTDPSRTWSTRVSGNIRGRIDTGDRTHAAFARSIGMSTAGLSRRLNGHARWDIDEVVTAATVLDVAITDLLAPVPTP